ncbi:MAG: hypothetical protein NT027_15945 [Proteobacteria bacterium]|nr:hypothetical protein [Pseudomonadota bacterium]
MIQLNKKLDASRGYQWFVKAWGMFTTAPMMFVLWQLAFYGGSVLLSLVPFGFILQMILGFINSFGAWTVIHHFAKTKEFDWKKFLSPFDDRLGKIIVFAILAATPVFVGVFVSAVYIIAKMYSVISGMNFDPENPDFANILMETYSQLPIANILLSALFTLICIVISVVIQSFGSPLIVLTTATPLEAAKLSLKAFFSNLGAIFIAILTIIGIGIAVILTFGMGAVVASPLIILAQYIAFMEILGGKNTFTNPTPHQNTQLAANANQSDNPFQNHVNNADPTDPTKL